jgi:hypothetical protein
MSASRMLLGVMIIASVSSFAAREALAADVFTLKSSTFDDGKIMPKKVANNAANTQTIRTASAKTCRQSFRGAMCRKGPRALSCS